jgi:hypothetical protein
MLTHYSSVEYQKTYFRIVLTFGLGDSVFGYLTCILLEDDRHCPFWGSDGSPWVFLSFFGALLLILIIFFSRQHFVRVCTSSSCFSSSFWVLIAFLFLDFGVSSKFEMFVMISFLKAKDSWTWLYIFLGDHYLLSGDLTLSILDTDSCFSSLEMLVISVRTFCTLLLSWGARHWTLEGSLDCLQYLSSQSSVFILCKRISHYSWMVWYSEWDRKHQTISLVSLHCICIYIYIYS